MPRSNLKKIVAIACCAIFLITDSSMIVSAQDSDPLLSEENTLIPRVLPGSLRSYQLDHWSVLSIRAENHSESADAGTVSVYLEEDNRTQYARRYWVPGNATRYTWLPIRTPAKVETKKSNLEVSVLDLNESGGETTLQRKRGEQLVSKTFLTLDSDGLNIGLIEDRSIQETSSSPNAAKKDVDEITDLVRLSHYGDSTLSRLSSRSQFLPPFPAAYDGLDQLVIATDRLSTDSGGSAAIRSWIFNGGHAWIMADRVDLNSVRMLLGNAMPFEPIDRIELNEFTIDTPRPAGSKVPEQERWSSVEPVNFLRVAATSVDVYSSIDGWPASFSVPFGKGRIFFTTLQTRGWLIPNDPFTQSPVTQRPPTRPTVERRQISIPTPPGGRRIKAEPTQALLQFADRFNDTPDKRMLLGENLKPILGEQIGYKIPKRSIAAILLGLSCVVIAGTGIWLARNQQLEKIALVVPLCTAFSAIALIWLGNANRSSVPATAASLRLAKVDTGLDIVRSDTLTGYYSPDTQDLPLASSQSGTVYPDIEGLTGVVKRTTWDDDGAASWQNVSVAAGSIRFARTQENLPLDDPIRAHAQFGANGLEGTIEGVEQLGELDDAVIQSPSAPRSSVSIERSGKFQITPDHLLAKGEFITNTLLDDTQQKRQTFYRGVLDSEQGKYLSQVSTLFAWSNNDTLGFAKSDSFQQSDATLFSVPLEIDRTPSNRPFLIPATFVRAAPANAQAGQLYDAETRLWLKDVNFQSEVMMHFNVPAAVVPCQIKTAQLTLKINAPSRALEILGMANGTRSVIESRSSPSGVIVLNIDDPDLLQLDQRGRLQFGFKVSKTQEQIEAAENRGPPPAPNQIATWQVDYMRLLVTGETD